MEELTTRLALSYLFEGMLEEAAPPARGGRNDPLAEPTWQADELDVVLSGELADYGLDADRCRTCHSRTVHIRPDG